MNSIVKVASRFSSLKNVIIPVKQTILAAGNSANYSAIGKRQFTRNLWHMCSSRKDAVPTLSVHTPTINCTCGCGTHQLHTKAEKDLVDFLTDEIATEKKTQQKKTIPSEIEGFKIEVNDAEVTLTKKSGNETISVYLNVNHTVDADAGDADFNPNMDKPDFADMKSRPGFEVELIRGSQTLGFTCSFVNQEDQPSEDGYNDLFCIDEVTMYGGEWSEKTYAVSGEILDASLYDLLMNLLEEKGISNEFAEKLSDFCTAYEHSLYVSLLQKLQKFASG